MKTLALCSVLFAGAFATPAWAQDPVPLVAQPAAPSTSEQPADEVELARQIVDVGFPEEVREETFFAVVDQMTMQMRESVLANMDEPDPGAIAILDEWTQEYIADGKVILRSHIPSLMNGWALSYASIFSKQELEDILAFVSTPSGQQFFQLSSAVMAEPNFAAANQAYMNEVNRGLPAAQRELMRRLVDYFEAKEAAPDETNS